MNELTEVNQVWSTNEETFDAKSLGELFENNSDGSLELGSIVYVGTAVHPDPTEFISVDDLLDQIGDRAYDLCGEYADDYPDVAPEAKQELNEFLSNWVRTHCSPRFYTVNDVRRYTISERDIAENVTP